MWPYISKKHKIEEWCTSWFHDWFYGNYKVINKISENVESLEWFCNKCNKKTDGLTTFSNNIVSMD